MNEEKVYCSNCCSLDEMRSFDGEIVGLVCKRAEAKHYDTPYGIEIEVVETYMDKNSNNHCRDYCENTRIINPIFLKK